MKVVLKDQLHVEEQIGGGLQRHVDQIVLKRAAARRNAFVGRLRKQAPRGHQRGRVDRLAARKFHPEPTNHLSDSGERKCCRHRTFRCMSTNGSLLM